MSLLLLDKPYPEIRMTPGRLHAAMTQARAEKKVLMVTFGANWCSDCLNLARKLDAKNVVELKVDVGEFDRNMDIAKALGVKLDQIPTALFFSPEGKRIGVETNTRAIEAFLKRMLQSSHFNARSFYAIHSGPSAVCRPLWM